MSSHFSGREEAVHRSSLSYLLSPNRPRSAGEQRFIRHAVFRATAFIGFIFYFIYCNPEYSYTYSYLQKEYGLGLGEPWLPKLLKLQKRPPVE
ncbi:hypothetical proten, conserved [Trypanosoma brucei gambiense DAL972]|uniref:Uncharacterized protein n=2 Tax=Trypanosoma brucei TaxID=5691 RepID=Q382W1_TRYB2|nr:hypothetical proten, conserved [Trypanosoma brucei gambiense DAL972]XP_829282.1 hypothetical protein, conserved [Trypanosoma brucei brucei TREU927]EAN80170.1 hypothetical protein, conserved [Trypanosoma brucei brucei TREU927]CBH18245.1 hypothetical proten, conserved [Trypanosoma brucei gambiense DAL972]|eukprot:XP_011780509.1 hypothetical proten, conserved [Trypanosoma brucei gambiense DAL972]